MKRTGNYVTSLIGLVVFSLLFSNAIAATDGFYQLSRAATASWEGASGNLTSVPTADYNYAYGDEGSVEYTLPWPLTFYGKTYSQITADTNGAIWFTATSSGNSFDLAAVDHGPVIVAWNNDLSTNYYGGVFIRHKTNPERVVIEWQTETYTEEGYACPNNFEIGIAQTGIIRFNYKSFSTQSGRDFGSGISAGNGISSLNLTTNYGNIFSLSNSTFLFVPSSTVSVTVTKAGAGNGSVMSDPVGITCGDLCGRSFTSGLPITFTAIPTMGSYLATWSGCDLVSGNNCMLTPENTRIVSAIFAPFRVSSQSPLAGGIVGSAYIISLHASGGVQPLLWTINSGTLPQGFILNSSLAVIEGKPTTKGVYAFTVQATDVLGAKSVPSPFEISITDVPLISTIATPKEGATVIGPLVTITGTAVDVGGPGVKGVEISTDNGVTWLPATGDSSWSYAWSPLTEGEYTVLSRATDLSGTVEPRGMAVMVTVDLPPALVLSTLSDGASTSSSVLNVAGSVTDSKGIRSLTINGANVTVHLDGSFSHLVVLHAGTTILITVATDITGNQTTDSRTITFDQLLSKLTVTTPADNSTSNRSFVAVIGGVDDPNATVTVVVNGEISYPAALSGKTYSATINLAVGLNTLEITVTDLMGKKNSMKRTVIAHVERPTISFTTPGQDIETTTAVQKIVGSVADNVDPVTVTVSDGDTTYTPDMDNGSFSQEMTLTDVKSYQIMVTVVDSAGNKTTVPRNILFKKTNAITKFITPTAAVSQTISGTREVSTIVSVECRTASVGTVVYPNDTTWQVLVSALMQGVNPLTVTFSNGNGLDMTECVTLVVNSTAPTVTAPGTGYVGNSVVLRGTNYIGVIGVKFNTTVATSYTVDSPTQITAIVPAGATTGRVGVSTTGGTGLSATSFIVIMPPTITSFTPLTVLVGGRVTITGTNLGSATAVTIAGVGATIITNTTYSIVATVPLGAGSGPISVTTMAGTSTSALSFTVKPPVPTVAVMTPVTGIVGSTMTITGTSMTGATAVKFNTIVAQKYLVDSPTQITAVVPVGATTGRISVTTAGGSGLSATSFIVIQSPTITGFTPATVLVGGRVTITGTNLGSASTVTIAGVGATIVTNTASLITATVPVGVTSGPLSVTTVAGVATSVSSFTVKPPAPTVTVLTPISGIVGSTVVIAGSNLTGTTILKFNTSVATGYTIDSSTQITATVPIGAITGKISVITTGGTGVSATSFTVILPPTIASFLPVSGLAGSTVTLSGTNLAKAISLTYKGIPALIVSNTATSISSKVPAGATTGSIIVTTVAGTATSLIDFTVPAPIITTIAPITGGVGTGVTIYGTNFIDATAVSFNSVKAPFVVANATHIYTSVPPGATTGLITVTTPSGTTAGNSIFTVGATSVLPAITGLAPIAGGVGGSVTLTGRNFVGTSQVKFNSVPATIFTVLSNTSIVTAVPPGATTGPISVTSAVGTSSSSAGFIINGTLDSPAITTFNPLSGKIGTVISVTGTNLGGVTRATIGGVGSLVQRVSPTSRKIIVVAGAVTGSINVMTDGGIFASAGSFTVIP